MSAQTDVKKEFNYKNLSKYLNEAIELLEIGDFKMGSKKLTYAKKAADKLIAKGFEADLQEELAQIKACESKIANPQSSPSLPKTNAPMDIRSTAHALVKQTKVIQELFEYAPAYAGSLPKEYTAFGQNFNKTAFLEKCTTLLATSEINEPKYKRQLKEIKAAENLVQNLTTNAQSAGVFNRIDDMLERMKTFKENLDRFQKSATDYLNVLIQLMPNNNQLKEKLDVVSATGRAINQEKQAAAATAQKQADGSAAAKAASAAAAKKEADGLPVAGLKDAGLEAQFKRLGQVAIGSSFKIQCIIITASKWGVNNDALGRPIARSMITYAIGKDANGQCYKQAMTFTQNANRGRYGSTFYDSGWAYPKKKINCELI